MNTVKDLFFFYLLPTGEDIFQSLLSPSSGSAKDKAPRPRFPGLRESALTEIKALEFILANDDASPGYTSAAHDLTVRLRRLNYPAALMSRNGLYCYYDYLIKNVNPTAQELRWS